MHENTRKALIKSNTKHSLSKTSEYQNWKEMLKRCFNEKNKRYKDYAERGISVHEDFVSDFLTWISEIGPKPSDDRRWSVGRIDNNGWYTYGNMRWETDEQQARNHTMQRNNSTGVTGVKFQKHVIAGREYTTFVAQWTTLDGKRRSKDFSTNKYGHEKAFDLACQHRKQMIEELNRQGAGYAKSHGSEK